ncbi:MAG: class I SAM-dependent methyltransferase [Patescibacteria group bacterium]
MLKKTITHSKILLSKIGLREILIDLGFIHPELQQSIIKRPISKKLIQIYDGDEGHGLNFTQYFLGFALVHYALVRNIKAKNILCIGSCKGFIPATLALACKDNQIGRVDFVDASYSQHDKNDSKKHWRGIGFWKSTNPKKHFAKIKVDQYIDTYVMTSKQYAQKFPQKKYQYIYIDGDHSYEGVKLDYKLFWPKLEKNGFMVFHDVVAKGYLDKGLFGVWKFWQELKNKNHIIFPFPKESGLGILQKR